MEAFPQTGLPDFQKTQTRCENLKSNAKLVYMCVHMYIFLKRMQSFFFFFHFPKGPESLQSRLESGPGVWDGVVEGSC